MNDVLLLISNAPREMARVSALAVLPALFTVRYMLVAANFGDRK
jgi:hypothetical protein